MGRVAIVCLRVLQSVSAAANLALSAYVVNWYVAGIQKPPPPSLTFLLFAPSFSLLSIAYLELAPRCAPRAAHHLFLLAIEALNAMLYFSGFIAYAVFLSKLGLCEGAVCATARMDAVVAAAAFTVWIASTMLASIDAVRGKPNKAMAMSPPRRNQMRYTGERLES